MRDVARAAIRLLDEERPAKVARVVAMTGIGGRRAGEALIVTEEGTTEGRLLGGLAEEAVRKASGKSDLVELPLGDAEAVVAGLACGGTVTLLVSDVAGIPRPAWEALAGGAPVALVSLQGKSESVAVLEDRGTKSRSVLGSLGGDDGQDAVLSEAVAALRSGRDSSALLEDESGRIVVEAMAPSTHLHVLGSGELVEAFGRLGGLLGWSVEGHEAGGSLEAVLGQLTPSDAILVISHDHDEATPVLATALGTGCYVGALGSRHTEEERRRRLREAGVPEEDLGRLHCPAGLDLGSRTPEETALSISAEILAVRSGRRPESLSRTAGPVNG